MPEIAKDELTFKKETKGTFVYESIKEDAPVPTLYVRKHAFPDKDNKPDKITITLEVA